MSETSAAAFYSGHPPLSDPDAPGALLQDIALGRNRDRAVGSLIASLSHADYTIADLLQDVAELKQAIARKGTDRDLVISAWTALDRGVGDCLEATTLTHERFIESTSHAFCYYDHAGIILSANQTMLDLDPDCIGRPLADCFVEVSAEARQAIAGASQRIFDLSMRTRRSPHPLPVLVEFGRIQTDADAGGYALVLDNSDRVRAEEKALDAATFGMLRLDAKHRIVYATGKAQELFESSLDELVGQDARRLLADLDDEESLRRVVREGFQRRKGQGNEYDLVVKRPKSGKLTHIRVSSVPLFDAAGNVNGSIERLQPIDRLVARDMIADAIANETDYRVLYQRVIAILKPFIDFEWANLFVYSPDRDFSRLVCEHGPAIEYESRWFPTPPGYKDWLKGDDTSVPDLRTYDPSVLDRNTQLAIEGGIRGLLCIPVRQAGMLKGGLCLASREPGFYSAEARGELEGLMLEQALLQVVQLCERDEADFLADLVRTISRIEDLGQLATEVVGRLARFYQFQNVSIFKVNAVRGHFVLLAQGLGRDRRVRIRDGYRQPIDRGLLGRCFASGRIVTVPDLHDRSSETAKLYENAIDGDTGLRPRSRSELCIPIRLFNRILWILDIEDDRKDAFTELEVETLTGVIRQIQSILERVFQSTMLAQVLDVCPAAIVITNQAGTILRCNREAAQMLQVDLLQPGGDLRRFLPAGLEDFSTEPTTTKIVGAAGREVPVQVSVFTLEEEYDHNVFLLQDVAELNWSMNFEKIKAALAETTAEVRVPISLLSTYLRRLDQQVADGPMRELVGKAARQLDRIELTYDRVLASYGKGELPPAPESAFDVGLLIGHILSDLPSQERRTIALPERMDFAVRADPYRILFALTSMLSYLLRSRCSCEPVELEVSEAGGLVEIAMSAAVAPNPGVGDLAGLVNATRAEIGLARNVLARIARDAGGQFRSRRTRKRERLWLRLPIAAGR